MEYLRPRGVVILPALEFIPISVAPVELNQFLHRMHFNCEPGSRVPFHLEAIFSWHCHARL